MERNVASGTGRVVELAASRSSVARITAIAADLTIVVTEQTCG
jgi:hypothetical protein